MGDIPGWPDPQVTMTKTAQVIHPWGTELGVRGTGDQLEATLWKTTREWLKQLILYVFIIKDHLS